MVEFSEKFLFVYNIIFCIMFIILNFLIYQNISKLDKRKEYYIVNETIDKRFIEYIPNFSFVSENENINPNLFSYKIFDLYCFCKNNTDFRVFDKNLCLTSKECDKKFHFLKNKYKVGYLSI